jgi:hypothetical protein
MAGQWIISERQSSIEEPLIYAETVTADIRARDSSTSYSIADGDLDDINTGYTTKGQINIHVTKKVHEYLPSFGSADITPLVLGNNFYIPGKQLQELLASGGISYIQSNQPVKVESIAGLCAAINVGQPEPVRRVNERQLRNHGCYGKIAAISTLTPTTGWAYQVKIENGPRTFVISSRTTTLTKYRGLSPMDYSRPATNWNPRARIFKSRSMPLDDPGAYPELTIPSQRILAVNPTTQLNNRILGLASDAASLTATPGQWTDTTNWTEAVDQVNQALTLTSAAMPEQAMQLLTQGARTVTRLSQILTVISETVEIHHVDNLLAQTYHHNRPPPHNRQAFSSDGSPLNFGALVVLKGLTTNKNLNDRPARVTAPIDSNGRLTVTPVDLSVAPLLVKPANLELSRLHYTGAQPSKRHLEQPNQERQPKQRKTGDSPDEPMPDSSASSSDATTI